MSSLAVAFVLICVMALAVLPRQWAAAPLLAAACYMPFAEGLSVGPFHFYSLRIVLAAAVVRILLRHERPANPWNGLDRAILLWSVIAVAISLFYDDVLGIAVNRLGMVYTVCGTYFALRVFCGSIDDVARVCRMAAILLLPLAAAMLYESLTRNNLFALFGGVPDVSEIRNGRVRAQGPFSHPILAGTVGAAVLPLMAGIWASSRKTAIAGIVACLTMVYTSGSSGPVLTAACGLAALFAWRFRHRMRAIRWIAVVGYLGLEVVMNAPAYYILSYLDVTGSSTSWHRAALIEAALTHWSEWWLVGTSYTRHWLPYGVPWSKNHIDITNQYLRMGVDGGLPLMLAFIAVLVKGFAIVGKTWRIAPEAPSGTRLLVWTLGASLFAHAAAFVSVAYFDQTMAFLYLTLAAIASSAMAQPAAVPNRPRRVARAGLRPPLRPIERHLARRGGPQ